MRMVKFGRSSELRVTARAKKGKQAMEITEVRIKIVDPSGEKLLAFCSITFDDCFVVRDLKIIGGTTGPFVAMPSRKLTAHCPSSDCGSKNYLKANYCNTCGQRLNPDRMVRDTDGRAKLYADIAHPINSACREMIQNRVVEEYNEELDRWRQPGYRSTYDDYDGDTPASAPRPAAAAKNHRIQAARSEPPAPHARPEPQPNREDRKLETPQGRAGEQDFGAGIF